jgi:hypothetical protein
VMVGVDNDELRLELEDEPVVLDPVALDPPAVELDRSDGPDALDELDVAVLWAAEPGMVFSTATESRAPAATAPAAIHRVPFWMRRKPVSRSRYADMDRVSARRLSAR